PRYTFQFIGIALIIIYPCSILFIALYYLIIPYPSDIQFPPEGIFEHFFALILPLGLLIAILGYYGPYQGKALRFSRDIIIREGKKIYELTNGYSNRPFSKQFEEIGNLDVTKFADISKRFARSLAYY
ncbi:MAG: hypothetical protein JSV49_11770, partial [Thermoplasmata archaeon]